ncbi:MAG: LysR family transcriptional regulator [Rickettsiales bacterium]|nr:LysR family transcriptional regulator [Rickettsiales bacterium]
MDHISRIGIFLEVVKQQSFAGAARKLGMTGPAISKQVSSLEDQLGVRLLNRTTRQVMLTEQGAIYSEKARKALEDLNEAEQQIQELKECPTGILRVNAPMSFGRHYLTTPIASFAKRYPEVRVEVDFDDRNVDILAEGYDVVVRIAALKDSSFISRKLADCPVLLYASPQLLAEKGIPKTPDALSDMPSIIYSKHGIDTTWHYEGVNGAVKMVQLQKQFVANSGEMMLEACLQGIGIASLPIFITHTHVQSGALVQLLPEYPPFPHREIHAIFPQNRYLSIKTRLFVDHLTQCAGSLPW